MITRVTVGPGGMLVVSRTSESGLPGHGLRGPHVEGQAGLRFQGRAFCVLLLRSHQCEGRLVPKEHRAEPRCWWWAVGPL